MSRKERVSVHKLKESDIKRCEANTFIDNDGVIIELKESWKEIVIALLTVLNYVKSGQLLNALFKAKISSPNMLVTKDKVKTFGFDDNSIYKIEGSKYYVICDLKTSEYLKIIKQLCLAANFDSKNCFIEMTQYSTVEQDIGIVSKKKQHKTEFIRLSDIKSHDISKYKVTGVQIGFEAYNCKSYNELIALIVDEAKKNTDSWYDRLKQYTEKTSIKVKLTEEDSRGFKIESHASKGDAIEFIIKICKEFDIDVMRVIILFKEIAHRSM